MSSKKLMVSMVKIGTCFKLKHHSGMFVKVDNPNTFYQSEMLYYADKAITEIIKI